MKKLVAFFLFLLLAGCTVSQTQSGSGQATNKPTDSTTTTTNN
jgi:hypothetical protein